MDENLKSIAKSLDTAQLDSVAPGWRDLPVTADEAGEVLGLQAQTIRVMLPRNGENVWLLGAVVDYGNGRPQLHKRNDLDVSDPELDRLKDDSAAFLLALQRHAAPASVVFTSALLVSWGKNKSRLTSDVIPQFPAAYKADFAHTRGGRYQMWILNGQDLLAWIDTQTEHEYGNSTDQIRDLFRCVQKNVGVYRHTPTTLKGAIALIKAWRTFDVMLAYQPPEDPAKEIVAVSTRRLRNYISSAAHILASADPAWPLLPIDTEFVDPDLYYLVEINGGWPRVVSRTGYRTRSIAGPPSRQLDNAGAISITPGKDIIARPAGFTEQPAVYTPGRFWA